jgi:uncharacterized protein with GYD domain
MPSFIMLTPLLPGGVCPVKSRPEQIREVHRDTAQLAETDRERRATLGEVDFASVVEAADERTMARVSLGLGSRGSLRDHADPAIATDDFMASL